MKLKKILALAISAALAVSCAFVLTGCGEDPAKLIEDALTKKLDTYKNKDPEAVAGLVAMADNEGFDEMDINGEEFAATMLEGFDYTIDDVTVDGKNATATVTIISKSYNEFKEMLDNILAEITEDPSAVDMTQDEIYVLIGQRIMEALNSLPAKPDTTTIEYTLNGNEWQPVDGSDSLADVDSVVFHQ